MSTTKPDSVVIDSTVKIDTSKVSVKGDSKILGNSEIGSPSNDNIKYWHQNKLKDVIIKDSILKGHFSIEGLEISNSTINPTKDKPFIALYEMIDGSGEPSKIMDSELDGDVHFFAASQVKNCKFTDVVQTQSSRITDSIIKGMEAIVDCVIEDCSIVGTGGILKHKKFKNKIITVNGETEPTVEEKVELGVIDETVNINKENESNETSQENTENEESKSA